MTPSPEWQGSLRLIAALRDPGRYPHPVERVELIETHISWVLLAGDYAYKLKKPLSLEFLDFGTLEKRRSCCAEELRLNRRTAPELYLEVVPVTGSAAEPRLGGSGEAIEYAVKMRRFPQEALADRQAKRGALGAAQSDAIGAMLAAFHATLPGAPAASPYGTHEHVSAPALQNFEQIAALAPPAADRTRLERLRGWTEAGAARLRETFAARRREGLVRECHGDLHLGNIAFIEGRPVPFDCIEFNPELRWIDVMNEAAFLVMDLLDHRLEALAWRLLNAYLGATGDYAGVRVLRFYLVYRAMVRAKVECIRCRQPGIDEAARAGLEREFRGYVALAESLAAGTKPALVLMHGLSGSGKSAVSQALLERAGALRLRADVERKRLHGLAAQARTGAAPAAGIYSAAATRLTYERLAALASAILGSGYPAIVDAAFLARDERERFRALAERLRVPWLIVSCQAAPALLRERVEGREAAARDASEAGAAVLGYQLATQDPLDAGEIAHALTVETDADEASLGAALERIATRIAGGHGSAAPH